MRIDNQIRNGNYFIENDKIIKWETIFWVYYYKNNFEIKPIFLNNDLFLKLGFVEYNYHPDSISYKKDDYFITKGVFQKLISDKSAVILRYELEYLHDLQNLWFALTGEELKINE